MSYFGVLLDALGGHIRFAYDTQLREGFLHSKFENSFRSGGEGEG